MSALPIDPILPELAAALAGHPSAVLEAPPGAGKTTRVPLALLDAEWLGGRKILMLEPRRLAARAACARMADSLGEAPGETVGYRVRLDSCVGPKTRIEVVTEGILTRMLQDDPFLEGVGLVIFDEFHERNLQGDLGLALALDVQAGLREELRLLVMSATIEGDAVARLLGGAPVVKSEGRSFPVTTRYLDQPPPKELLPLVAAAIRRALVEESGSLLAFLPGAGEIRRVQALLEAAGLGDEVILAPLYGDLGRAEQDRAIAPPPPGRRKVVLATTIAETSLTIEGVRVVVDAGLARVPRFEPRSGLTRLETVRVSQASAEQRRGRAGRLEPGICYRLWTEHMQQGLVPHAAAEILEADLAPLALELARWGVSDPARLAWLDPPPAAAYAQAIELLRELGALGADGGATPHGRELAGLGVHPRLGHMLVKGRALGQAGLAARLAGLLSERDPLRGEARREVDVRLRLEALTAFDSARAPREVDRGTCQRIRAAARDWCRRLGVRDAPGDPAMAGLLLAFAYPDRIARRRPGPEPRYLLANGRGAAFAEHETLSAEEFIVVAELGGGSREARIYLAAALDRADLERHFAELIEARSFVTWDHRSEAVLARRQRHLGEIVLDDAPQEAPPAEAVAAAMLDGIRELGLECLPWSPALRNWQARVQFLHRADPAWPDVGDAALLAEVDAWLGPFLGGISRCSQLSRVDLAAALEHRIGWERARRLDALAPTHLTVPTGSRIRLDYTQGEIPVLAVRLQELFGLADTPAIAGGRVPVLLHLLSPAQRPVQVTRDLAGFWGGSYAEVKKEMKGRYPKHYWPDDPLQAAPTRRTKRRPGD